MFKNKKINKNTYHILNAGCDVYLLDGECPVLVDCGCAKENIQVYVSKLINKDVKNVICTHSHIDHTGSCGLFKNVYMSAKTALSAKNPMDEDTNYLYRQYQPILIEDGEILSFNNIKIEVIMCDCHASGNVMFLDLNNGILFTGDELDKDQVLLLPSFAIKKGEYHSKNAASVYDYKKMLEKIWLREKEYDILCTGHNGSPLNKKIIKDMIQLCDSILSGKKGIRDCSGSTYNISCSHFPYPQANYRRYSEKGLSLVYCADSLFDHSLNSLYAPATPLHKICMDNIIENK